MENETTEMIRTLLVAQVLTLAKFMEADGKTYKSDHYLGDAVKEISSQRADILRRLSGMM